MTSADSVRMDRVAQPLLVEYKTTPYVPWRPVIGAQVERIEINAGARPSIARIGFPGARINWRMRGAPVGHGDTIRVRTSEYYEADRTILFQGFMTGSATSFSGGMGSGDTIAAGHDTTAIICHDYRWLLARTCPIIGQIARGPDDYTVYPGPAASPFDNAYRWLNGRRAIFNVNGRKNMDLIPLHLTEYGESGINVPIFIPPDATIAEGAWWWKARDMIDYCLSPPLNRVYNLYPLLRPERLTGLDHEDFDRIINHVVVDGLSTIEAVELVCRHIGWSFREEYVPDGARLVFFKPRYAESHSRGDAPITILHDLHAPAIGESVTDSVSAGAKLLWSMALTDDIAEVVNVPYGLGAPDRFEFTAQLVPAWNDNDFVVDTSDDLANLFFTDAELQEIENPEFLVYYRHYHIRGSLYPLNVARLWALNEAGSYFADDRPVFDFRDVIPAQYILDDGGKRLYAPFKRRFLPCLTLDNKSLNSIGIRIEFSFDGGSSWQIIPCSIRSVADECAIFITEPNLGEMVDKYEADIAGGPLDGIQLNYFTSLADDYLNGRSFMAGEWRTRIRVTASVQMDRRLFGVSESSTKSSPFSQARVLDFSDKYVVAKRTPSSIFATSGYPVDETDSTERLDEHLLALRHAWQDVAISGMFVLERLWIGEGSGQATFLIGDGIAEVTGRNLRLVAPSEGGGNLYPEIVQIVYLPAEQKTQLVTRDLRFAEVAL